MKLKLLTRVMRRYLANMNLKLFFFSHPKSGVRELSLVNYLIINGVKKELFTGFKQDERGYKVTTGGQHQHTNTLTSM